MCVGESSRERFSEGGPLQHIKGSKPSSGVSDCLRPPQLNLDGKRGLERGG